MVGKSCDDHSPDLFRQTENAGISLAGYILLAADFILLLIERDNVNHSRAPATLTLAMNPQHNKNKTAILHS